MSSQRNAKANETNRSRNQWTATLVAVRLRRHAAPGRSSQQPGPLPAFAGRASVGPSLSGSSSGSAVRWAEEVSHEQHRSFLRAQVRSQVFRPEHFRDFGRQPSAERSVPPQRPRLMATGTSIPLQESSSASGRQKASRAGARNRSRPLAQVGGGTRSS